MTPVLVHYSLILDLAGRDDIDATLNQFLEQADLTRVDKTVETIGSECHISFVMQGPDNLTDLRQVAKDMPRGLFSEATKAAVKNLKEMPSDLYLELTARPPLYGYEDED